LTVRNRAAGRAIDLRDRFAMRALFAQRRAEHVASTMNNVSTVERIDAAIDATRFQAISTGFRQIQFARRADVSTTRSF